MGEAHLEGVGAPAWTSVQGCHPSAGCQSMNRKGENLEDELSVMWSRSGASRGKEVQNKEQPSMGYENPCNLHGEILFRDHFPPYVVRKSGDGL